MDWKQKLQNSRDSMQKALDVKSEAAIEEHWPKIQQELKERLGPAGIAAVHNDQTMESTFKLVYSALPFPIRMAVKEEAFLKFCFSRRDKLLPDQHV
jgi:hypothetical protein